jgi:hypothetical protein
MRDFTFNGKSHASIILTSQFLIDYNITFVIVLKHPETVFLDEIHNIDISQVHQSSVIGGRILFVNNTEQEGHRALFCTKTSHLTLKTGDIEVLEKELDFFDTEVVRDSLSAIESATGARNRARSVFDLFYTIESRRLKNNESS